MMMKPSVLIRFRLKISVTLFGSLFMVLGAICPLRPAHASGRDGRPPIFRPVPEKPARPVEWNRRNAAHLMRRAGFSVAFEALDGLVDQDQATTLDELLNPEQVQQPPGFESLLRNALVDDGFGRSSPGGHPMTAGIGPTGVVNLLGQRDLWFYRMVHSNRQLEEKLVFFWHDHFATSADSIFQVTRADLEPLIELQHRLIRKHAMGNFREFVREMARDPAMLRWLDGVSNVAEDPNENFARELLELFTLGLGNYTEEDIQEAARAFTGWSFDIETGDFLFIPSRHDSGEKTFLGLTGNLGGDDVIDHIFEQPATARFIARKMWEFFAYASPDEELVEVLAAVFRDNDYEIRPLMRALFERPEFYSDRSLFGLVKSPIEMTVNFFRESGLDPWLERSAGNYIVLRLEPFWVAANQNLMDPPDVSGWPAGRLWLGSDTLLSRFNFFAQGVVYPGQGYLDQGVGTLTPSLPRWLSRIINRLQLETADDFISHFLDRFLRAADTPDIRLALEDYMGRGPGGAIQPFDRQNPDADAKIRGLLYLILTLPEYQLN